MVRLGESYDQALSDLIMNGYSGLEGFVAESCALYYLERGMNSQAFFLI